MAAVSARKIVEPREAEIHPDFWKSCNSSSAQPPSGPIARTISFRPMQGEDITQEGLLFRLREDNAPGAGRRGYGVLQLDWSGDLGRSCAAGLLGGLERDSAPAFGALRRSRSQVSVGATGDYGNDSRDSQFGAFLDRPFHAVELEDGEQEGDGGYGGDVHFFPEFEFDSAILEVRDASAPHCSTGGDIEFLSYAGAQDADEMISVFSGEGGVIARRLRRRSIGGGS